VTGGTIQATHCEDRSGDVAFPPFSREDLVFALGIVETVSSRKADHVGFVDPKLPPPFPSLKGMTRVGYLSGTPSQGRVAPSGDRETTWRNQPKRRDPDEQLPSLFEHSSLNH
jgi:hypothetical protein